MPKLLLVLHKFTCQSLVRHLKNEKLLSAASRRRNWNFAISGLARGLVNEFSSLAARLLLISHFLYILYYIFL